MAANWFKRWFVKPAPVEVLHEILAELKPVYEAASRPVDITEHPRFAEGVRALASHTSRQQLFEMLVADNPIISLMSLEVLSRMEMDEVLIDGFLAALNPGWGWTRRGVLHVLARDSAPPIVGRVFATIVPERGWDEDFLLGGLREMVRLRAEREQPMFGSALSALKDARLQFLSDIFDRLEADAPQALVAELRAHRNQRVDLGLLKSIGRVQGPGIAAVADADLVEFEASLGHAGALRALLAGQEPRSVLVIGENGVGKSSILRLATDLMVADGWIVFETSAVDLVAGQSFVGQLEGRLQSLIREVESKKVVWIVPEFQELVWAGRHSQQPSGILEMLIPLVEQGRLRLVGEVRPAAYERLITEVPRTRALFLPYRVSALQESETLELGERWSAARSVAQAAPRASAALIRETALLARQYFPDRRMPGSVMQLLQITHKRLLAAARPASDPMTLDDVLGTLSEQTGLPRGILDDRVVLSIDALRDFFAQRVLGQREAIDVLVERVAMIKAGLTDPTRPSGVFLFVGPTGTGKTEIAKALAEFLFGSSDRLVRLDMTELQNPDAIDRIVGDANPHPQTTALVHTIRKQPFSVVLLDEFEKAHPQLWDLFLQVFDDGRLTDRRGNVSDFRHTIIIMTSNLGARLPHGASLGFTPGEEFASGQVDRAVATTFRREFVNRIDRVVVFRPLGRGVMRELVRKELRQVVERRGLRNKQWAVEWDEGVIDFLLEKGFSPDLGARPLKRAIERYLLAPLATTIVRHEVPEGDQFLFVRAEGDALHVQFVDPDAPESSPPAHKSAPLRPGSIAVPAVGAIPAARTPEHEAPRLEVMLGEARGTQGEIVFLKSRVDQLQARISAESLQASKRDGLARMAEQEFWQSPERFETLGRIEYLDRIKAGFETAESLLQRLTGSGSSSRSSFPKDLVSKLALQMYLLEAACTGIERNQPWDAFISVRSSYDDDPSAAVECDAHARRIARMYTQWAAQRRMQIRVIELVPDNSRKAFRWVAAISGYAAYSFLALESGWHVLEVPDGDASFQRARIEVRVAPQPWEPQRTPEDLGREAARALGTTGTTVPAIVRRYRQEPSPLVRDTVRGWRTGRLDRVLAGDFDLIQ